MELAMKRQMKYALIAIFSVIAFVAAIYQGFSSVHAESLETASPRSLYLQHCARCHGSDGRANTPMGRKLEAADLTNADVQDKRAASISRAIKNGRPGMPAFGKRLRPAQISSIANFVRSF
jgi:mono/diheme cytochrome c family protein